MQAALRAPVVLRSLMLAVVGVLPLDLVTASAQAPRAPAAETPPANLDTLKARDQELEALRAEQRRTLENEARLKREIESIGDDRRKFNQQIIDTASRVVGWKSASPKRRSASNRSTTGSRRCGPHWNKGAGSSPRCWRHCSGSAGRRRPAF